MRPAVALVFATLLPAAVSAGVADARRTPAQLVPNEIAFRDPTHGIAGSGSAACSYPDSSCSRPGAISLTSDAGRTWRVVLRTPRPVMWVGFQEGAAWARLDDGENLRSHDRGRTWQRAVPPPAPASPCPPVLAVSVNAVVTTPGGREWALCAGEGGAGNMGKAVYRLRASGWSRVAWTPLAGHGYGGISSYGYPLGMAMADDGFGLIWESRGTLYVTRDGGSHWHGLPKVAEPEVDFGVSGTALPHRVGFVVLLRGTERLLETSDAGRTWHLRHRWR